MAFDARDPGKRASGPDLLQVRCGERIQGLLADLARTVEIATPQPCAREKDGRVLSDLVVAEIRRCEMIGQSSFDLVGLPVLHPNESFGDHESGAAGIVEVADAVVRADDPRRRLSGRGARGQREREVGEATRLACSGLRSHLGGEAVQHATIACDEGGDEAASEQVERGGFITCHQQVTERPLDVAGIDEERGGAPMQGLLAVRIVGVESVAQQLTEQVVVPVGVAGQLDEEEVPFVDAAEQHACVAAVGHSRASLWVELVEHRRCEEEVEDLRGLAFEDLGSEEVRDGPWRLRELRQEEIGDRFIAKRDGGHLDARRPTLGAGGEELDLVLVQIDSEPGHDGGDFGLCESEFGVAYLEQSTVRPESVQRELWFGSAGDDHTAAGRQALDERGHAGCRGQGELEVVDHDHDRPTERREVVHERDRDVVEVGFGLGEQVGRVMPAVRPPTTKRDGERKPEGDRVGIALVARQPDRRKLGPILQP